MTIIQSLFDNRSMSQISYNILMARLKIRSCPRSEKSAGCPLCTVMVMVNLAMGFYGGKGFVFWI